MQAIGPKHHTIRTYGGVEEQPQSLFTSALDGGASAKYQSELNPWYTLN
jgi:hypothetical protein